MEIYIDTKQLREYCKSLDSVFRHMQNHGGPLTSGEKSLYNAIRRYMNTAENELRKLTIRGMGAAMPHDPRGAHVSVSRDKVKSVNGAIRAQIKIYQPKTAGSVKASYIPERKLDKNPHQRGGNRLPRSRRTEMLQNYGPRDRGFILRWLESGTSSRKSRYGNRGSIAPHARFGPISEQYLEPVLQRLCEKIEKKTAELIYKGKLD